MDILNAMKADRWTGLHGLWACYFIILAGGRKTIPTPPVTVANIEPLSASGRARLRLKVCLTFIDYQLAGKVPLRLKSNR
jgi:hypothetical protein